MLIQYYGDFCFKITTKPGGRATDDVIILTDPLAKGAGLRAPQGTPDILLLSHLDQKNSPEVKEESVPLDMPGEYSACGMSFQAYPSFRDETSGSERGQNTIFTFESEELHIVYLGALGHELNPDLLDKISNADILFIPVGGKDTLKVTEATDLIRKIEPKIIIPMHFTLPGLNVDTVVPKKAFCDAMGVTSSSTLTKLNIKKKDLEEKNMEVIFMERGA